MWNLRQPFVEVNVIMVNFTLLSLVMRCRQREGADGWGSSAAFKGNASRGLQQGQPPTLPDLQWQKSANYAKLASLSREPLVSVQLRFHYTCLLVWLGNKWGLPYMVLHLVMWWWLCKALCSGRLCVCPEGITTNRGRLSVFLLGCWLCARWESVRQRLCCLHCFQQLGLPSSSSEKRCLQPSRCFP